MGTTNIDPVRTISEIQAYLVRMGATRIMNTYEHGEAVALHFVLKVNNEEIPFELPARVDPIYRIIRGDGRGRTPQRDLEQAKRTAWRQIYRWIQAQLALVETGMAKADEVFMPYMQVADAQGKPTTLYQRAVTGGLGRLALAERSEA